VIDERRTSPLLEGTLPRGGGDRQTGTTRAYSPRPGATWWLRNRRYVLYMLRELTAIPIAAWVIVFMVEVGRLQGGRASYQPLSGPLWIAFSALCLVCAVYHSVTFLSLAGRIIRIPKGEGYVQPRVIVGGMFALFAGATIVIAGLLVLGGMGAR
jgi:fumarate reductase subunit C